MPSGKGRTWFITGITPPLAQAAAVGAGQLPIILTTGSEPVPAAASREHGQVGEMLGGHPPSRTSLVMDCDGFVNQGSCI